MVLRSPEPGLLGAVALAYVEDLDAPHLEEEELRHLGLVRRLRRAEVVAVSDGTGGWRLGRWDPTLPARLCELEPVHESARPAPPVAVGLPLLKGDRSSWAVQHMTEAGVDRIVLVVAARSVVRSLDEGVRRRLERVARAAGAQSRRTWLPRVEGPVPLVALLDAERAAGRDCRLADFHGEAPLQPGTLVIVGPEGGWAASERAVSGESIGMGPTVMRAETAAVAATVLAAGIRSGIVGGTTQRAASACASASGR